MDLKISELQLGTPTATDIVPYVDLTNGITKKALIGNIISFITYESPTNTLTSGSVGDGVTTTFTVVNTPIWISVSGQTFVEGDGYSRSGLTVTFDQAPAPNATIHSFFANQLAQPDIVAPSVPTNLLANAISASQINLTWNGSTDNVAVVGYRVYRDGNLVGTTGLLSYSDPGLAASTEYDYQVTAYDFGGNASNLSNIAQATTSASGGGGGATPSRRMGSSLRLTISNIITWKGK